MRRRGRKKTDRDHEQKKARTRVRHASCRQFVASHQELEARRKLLGQLQLRRRETRVREARVWPHGAEFDINNTSSQMHTALDGIERAIALRKTRRIARHVPSGRVSMLTPPQRTRQVLNLAREFAKMVDNPVAVAAGVQPERFDATAEWLRSDDEVTILRKKWTALMAALNDPLLSPFFPRRPVAPIRPGTTRSDVRQSTPGPPRTPRPQRASQGDGGGHEKNTVGAGRAGWRVTLLSRITLPSSQAPLREITAAVRRARVFASLKAEGLLAQAELLLPELLSGPEGKQYAAQLVAGRAWQPDDGTTERRVRIRSHAATRVMAPTP